VGQIDKWTSSVSGSADFASHTGNCVTADSCSSRHVVFELDQRVDASLVEATIAVERECCPFFMLDYQSNTRRLTVSVAEDGHEPALAVIAFALGLGEVAERATSD
jgi:hypothetical protein